MCRLIVSSLREKKIYRWICARLVLMKGKAFASLKLRCTLGNSVSALAYCALCIPVYLHACAYLPHHLRTPVFVYTTEVSPSLLLLRLQCRVYLSHSYYSEGCFSQHHSTAKEMVVPRGVQALSSGCSVPFLPCCVLSLLLRSPYKRRFLSPSQYAFFLFSLFVCALHFLRVHLTMSISPKMRSCFLCESKKLYKRKLSLLKPLRPS